MSRRKPQRGPLLSSVVMVMLATAATGLLVVIGFQGLPDTVIPSNFGAANDHETRNVDVSDSPTPTPGPRQPSVQPSSATPTPVKTTNRYVRPAAPGSNPQPTSEPTTVRATTAPPKKTTSPSPSPTKVSPSPTSTTQPPSPAPSCGTGRKPRCPKSPGPGESVSPTRSTSSFDGGEAPKQSGAKAKAHKKVKPGRRR